MIKRTLFQAAHAVTPPILWNAYLRARGLTQYHAWQQFKNVGTVADTKPLFSGRFAELHDRYKNLNPFSGDSYRYLHYNVCYFASLCRHVPGDFVCQGVSFGATAKLVYEFVDLPALGKKLHLIDPFEGTTASNNPRIAENYNADPDYVLRQYPADAPIVLHRKWAPFKLPGPFAFVFTDTGNPRADAQSLPLFYEVLSSGGIIIA